MDEVRRWPGVELRPHASAVTPGEADGSEFRPCGRQVGHVHGDCALHLSLTRALRQLAAASSDLLQAARRRWET